jgi:phosphoglycolate phosphatase-like HAD superfamily hydrolase
MKATKLIPACWLSQALSFVPRESRLAAVHRLGAKVEHSVVIGDSIWDMLTARRARGLGVGLLVRGLRTGGT